MGAPRSGPAALAVPMWPSRGISSRRIDAGVEAAGEFAWTAAGRREPAPGCWRCAARAAGNGVGASRALPPSRRCARCWITWRVGRQVRSHLFVAVELPATRAERLGAGKLACFAGTRRTAARLTAGESVALGFPWLRRRARSRATLQKARHAPHLALRIDHGRRVDYWRPGPSRTPSHQLLWRRAGVSVQRGRFAASMARRCPPQRNRSCHLSAARCPPFDPQAHERMLQRWPPRGRLR